MTAKHAPATPLPWRVSGMGYLCNDQIALAPTVSAGGILPAKDAEYCAHACNAYPRLVELAELCRLYGSQPDARDARLVQLADDATDILRELGEGETT